MKTGNADCACAIEMKSRVYNQACWNRSVGTLDTGIAAVNLVSEMTWSTELGRVNPTNSIQSTQLKRLVKSNSDASVGRKVHTTYNATKTGTKSPVKFEKLIVLTLLAATAGGPQCSSCTPQSPLPPVSLVAMVLSPLSALVPLSNQRTAILVLKMVLCI